MRYEVNVSIREIGSAIDEIERYKSEIDDHSYTVSRAYEKISAKLKSLISSLEQSYANLSSDISDAKYLYSCNETELDKKDAELAKKAAAAGTTPTKCDRSVQTRLRELISNLERQKSSVQTSISNLNSSLRTLENLYSGLQKFYDKVKSALSDCITMANSAQNCVRRVSSVLSFGERSDGSLCVTSIAALGSYARSFEDIKSTITEDKNEILASLSAFTQNLTDDVSATAKENVGRVSEEVADGLGVFSDAARALNSACRMLSEYLRLANY